MSLPVFLPGSRVSRISGCSICYASSSYPSFIKHLHLYLFLSGRLVSSTCWCGFHCATKSAAFLCDGGWGIPHGHDSSESIYHRQSEWVNHSTVTSRFGNAVRITSPLWGESNGNRWIPLTKDQKCGSLIFFVCRPHVSNEQTRFETPSL